MNFFESIKICFTKYATFSGRASRSEFWYFLLFYLIVDICAEILDAQLAGESFWSYDEWFGPITSIFYIISFLPALAVTFRRLHDVNRSGWWCLIFITIIGAIPLFYWYAAKGIRGTNDYGEDPLKHLSDEAIISDTPKWIKYFLIPIGSIICIIGLLLIVLDESGMIVGDSVYTGEDLPETHLSKLRDQNIISSNENIKFIYSTGIFSILEDGQLLTESRLIAYTQLEEGNIEVYPMLLENIKEVQLVEEGGFLDDEYKVLGNNDAEYEYILISLPHDDKNGKIFIEELKSLTN